MTHFTTLDIRGGSKSIIHRNVYGGGSLGSVGPPVMEQDYLPYKPGQADIAGKPANVTGRQSLCTVNIAATIGSPLEYNEHYGGEVYGASRGNKDLDANQYGSVVWTIVNILNGATIQGNVFGGGDAGMVKKDSEVNVGEKATP